MRREPARPRAAAGRAGRRGGGARRRPDRRRVADGRLARRRAGPRAVGARARPRRRAQRDPRPAGARSRPSSEPDRPPSPRSQWAWGADYSPEKADEARREREREQLEQGLEKSRTGFGARLRSAFGGGDGADWEEIEEVLITGDVGAQLSMDVVERARKRRDLSAEAAVRAELARAARARAMRRTGSRGRRSRVGPAIVLVVGVNGTGKTTTIGKLAARERANGRRVVLAAADTFRAAAIDQLRIWAQRTDSEIVAHAPNADPAAVVFDALDAAIARHADIVIADTAGRLHTKSNLMEELAKVRRVIDKRLPGADGRDVLRPRRDDRPERPRAGEGVPRGGRADRRRAHEARLDGQGRHRVRDRARPRRPRPLRRGGGAGRRPAAVRSRPASSRRCSTDAAGRGAAPVARRSWPSCSSAGCARGRAGIRSRRGAPDASQFSPATVGVPTPGGGDATSRCVRATGSSWSAPRRSGRSTGPPSPCGSSPSGRSRPMATR